ncbi:MAG: hypothetical protein IJP48_01295 [Synergistaceae bacterium]|nr:hypothetical protein [Synergistaceae bacterium]
MNHHGLLAGELTLTLEIVLGLVLGEIVMKLRIAELIMKRFIPRSINPVTALALSVSFASSKTGAGIISSALEQNQITQKQAVWSTLMLSFPSYLKRWPGTFALALSMAGRAGAFFAFSQLIIAAGRFIIAFIFLPKEKDSQAVNFNQEITIKHSDSARNKHTSIFHRLIKTLPLAWLFFALAYSLVPVINKFFSQVINFPFIPLAGWTVAGTSIARVSAALALAGGAIASGELNNSQALFSLILGSGLGSATRILRMNAGYYFGLFESKLARKLLLMNFATLLPMIIINLIFAGIALLFNLI